ncbi:MAG: undecaprenyl-diphosphate phosphatase [Acidobacteria bacterium]|nr:undecaprenyl-diphosphate phosphatase [Acidobacteriota bacterium]
MSLLQIVVLALVQGVTEFLPISSSAHLILVPHVFGWADQGLHFDVAVNTGTLVAVILYFRAELVRVTRAGLGSITRPPRTWSAEARLGWIVALATIPVAVCGLLFYDAISTTLRSPVVIAVDSILFGLLLLWADRVGARRRDVGEVRWSDGVVVGLAQALALLPGTSRSGVTMTAGLATGLDRPASAHLSMLLAVPVGLLAAAKDLWEVAQAPPPGSELAAMALAAVLAAVSAYLVIGWLLRWLERQTYTLFVVYRVLLGVLILVLVL